MKLYYMRDDHLFRPLPLDVEQAVAAVREEFAAGQTCGMLCSKSLPCTPFGTEGEPDPHAHGGSFAEFEPQVRAWMAYALNYKAPADLEYESWAAVSGVGEVDAAKWPDVRNRGLLQAAKQAAAVLKKWAFTPGVHAHADLIYEARSYLEPAIKREELFRSVVSELLPADGVDERCSVCGAEVCAGHPLADGVVVDRYQSFGDQTLMPPSEPGRIEDQR